MRDVTHSITREGTPGILIRRARTTAPVSHGQCGTVIMIMAWAELGWAGHQSTAWKVKTRILAKKDTHCFAEADSGVPDIEKILQNR